MALSKYHEEIVSKAPKTEKGCHMGCDQLEEKTRRIASRIEAYAQLLEAVRKLRSNKSIS